MTEKLLNCPFCNGEARMMRESDGDCVGNFHFVECRLCRARSRGHFASYGNDCPVFYAGVREDWNRRASASDPVGEPVAWMSVAQGTMPVATEAFLKKHPEYRHAYTIPLYASPLPQEPREADARDAARYRWLRNRSAYFVYGEERQSPWTVIGTAYNDTRPCIGEELDVEVDAAMSTTESADSRGENRG
jgi:hypothetical protein